MLLCLWILSNCIVFANYNNKYKPYNKKDINIRIDNGIDNPKK